MRDVILFTLLPFLIGFYIIAASIFDYSVVRQFDDYWSRDVRLDTLFLGRISAVQNFPKMLALERRLDPEKLDSGIIRLQFQPEFWYSWQREPLALIGRWNGVTMVRENTLSRVRVRSRGDTSIHRMTEKISFTLRTPRSSLFKGYRDLAFSAKTVLEQYLVNRLASEFDPLAPFTTVAPVFVNQRYYGIFRVGELINESFLRRHGRLPGNIFRGDTAERGEVFRGLPRWLSVNPYIWDRVARDHRSNTYADATLQAFLLDANGTTLDDHLRLMSWVDLDEIASLLALTLVVGDPYHISDIHNNFWYEDPSTGLLHPIPIDLRLQDLAEFQSKHIHVSQLLGALLRDPFVLDRALHVIQRKVSGGRLLETAEQLLKSVSERYQEHFEYDRLREPFVPEIGMPNRLLNGLRNNIRLLNQWLGDSVVAFHAEPQLANEMILDFEARGYAGSDLLNIIVDGNMKSVQSVRLVADRNRNGILDASDMELPGKWAASESGGQFTITEPPALLPGVDTDKPGIKPAPLHYRFFLIFSSGIDRRVERMRVRAELRNRLTGEPSKVVEWTRDSSIKPTPSWHPWQYPPPSSGVEHRLTGDVHLRKTLVVPKSDTLVVDAGTTVSLDPDVSILSYGRVIVRGMLHQPVAFRPAIKGRPWGAIALQGEGANGSKFEHVSFNGGGGASLGRIDYTGMVNVHWAQQVTFSDCEFSDNVRSDDTLHAVHSNLTIKNSAFLRTNSDSIDFDYSTGIIANNRFETSGNDAFDLMGSSPQIIGNSITKAGDKGISVGENSHPFVFNNYIARSQIGVGIKDRSEPFLFHNTVTQNKIGISEYAKTWSYGSGGWGKLVNTVVVNNETDFNTDKHSRLTKAGSETAAGNPIPVSSTAGASVPTDLAWIFAHYGIRPTSDTSGAINGWKQIEPTTPRVFGTFDDDFEQISDGWVGVGGVSRLEKRDQNLQAAFSKRPGSISLKVNWNLAAPRYTYMVVFELAGRNIKSAAVSLLSREAEVTRAFGITGSLAEYRFVSMELKPGHYTTIKITADPGANTGRVNLHTYRLYAIPKVDETKHAVNRTALGGENG
ncbi:MAG TPA: right-handed parallel beta-helix repeat-containing protein [Candidatus Binatia bacterium]